jgi:hypothetical protein
LKHFVRALPLLLLFIFGTVDLAHAQGGSVYFGLGTADDKSSNQLLDVFGLGNPIGTPKMTGLFGTFGADAMFKPHLGFGGEVSLRFGKGAYSGLAYRPVFYDFNAIWQPLSVTQRVVPEFQAGLGGVKMSFYFSSSNPLTGTSNALVGASSHFQLHGSGGIRFYVTPSVYIRPQVDVRYVPNFFQFGRNTVLEYTMAIGYSFGR